MELAAYLHQHLAPHGNDSPIVYSDVLADQVADVCLHWLEHDDDGQATAWDTLAAALTAGTVDAAHPHLH